jgi:uncharacterized sporulation protein YeaH/YhbH (DUF444 family)
MSNSYIIDRRKNDKGKSTTNRNKFIKRIEAQIKKNIPNVLNNQSIKDISSGKGNIKVKIKGINEPNFTYDSEKGIRHKILPGNKDVNLAFSEGDLIPKPKNSGGRGGRKGSKDADIGEDEFVISITREEFLDFFFDDLELPDMTKKYLKSLEEYKIKRSGIKKDGAASNLDLVRSYKNSLSRRIGVEAVLKKKLKDLQNEYEETGNVELLSEIELTEKRLNAIPYLDEQDLRYKNFEKFPEPTTNAVMFCIMDISASMGEKEKDIARRFFTLLYIFLTKQYPKVDIVFIQHHTEAKEVTEEEFFNSRENGGTVITTALELTREIIRERYDQNWNIYVSQASDGDVWGPQDSDNCIKILRELLPQIQYMAYIEVSDEDYLREDVSDLWVAYKLISNKNFSMKSIKDVNQIWDVFKRLFKKNKVNENN